MKPWSVLPIVDTITEIGISMQNNGGVLYRYVEISEKGGGARRLTIVHASEALAELIAAAQA